jgi:hypothetical protein
VVFVLFDEAVEDFLGAEFFSAVLVFVSGGGGEAGFPEGKGFFGVCGEFVPGIQRVIAAEVAGGFGIGKQGGDDGFAIGEGAPGGGAFAERERTCQDSAKAMGDWI